MIEATCSACGTLNRIAESDVPVGAKFVNCTSCKSRVALPAAKPAAGAPAPKPMAVPAIPKVPGKPPAIPTPVPPSSGGTNDVIDLSDLPAPKRQSPLGNEASRPAPKSALASALEAELPVPKGRGPSVQQSASLDLDDLIAPPEEPELPAPKMRATTPRPPSEPMGFSDLPAPKPRAGAAPSTRASTPSPSPLSDLPGPRPGGARALTDMDMQPLSKDAADLMSDLPAPKAARPPAVKAPVAPPPPATPDPGQAMQPRGGDLMPKPGAAPGIDLPAPKGFFDDLPQPATKSTRADKPEVPAPKGFFDDLPQPAKSPRADKPEVPAPKGFFDDLPQKAQSKPGENVAPKGFFDDLPQKADNHKASRPEAPAPKGFFDDLPQPSRSKSDSKGGISIELGGDDALDSLDLAADDVPSLDLGASEIELDGPGGPPLDLASPGGSFDELDLSAPSVGPSAVHAPPGTDEPATPISFKKPSPQTAAKVAAEKAALPPVGAKASGGPLELELEEPRKLPGEKLGPKPKAKPVVDDISIKRAKQKKQRKILAAVLGVAVLGSGGFYMYNRHATEQKRQDEISEQLSIARKALSAEDAAHWQRAAGAAGKVLELDSKHAEAIGIAAEASLAGALADGKNAAVRTMKGRKLIADALGQGVTGPAIERAQALSMLTSLPDKAPEKLQSLLARSPKDGFLSLYLGWAHAAAGDPTSAVKAYDEAIANTPAAKTLAMLGRARAKLTLGDVEGARADYTAVLAIEKDNIPAQVGLAATLPQSQSQQQESDLLAILARKDIDAADPRAVTQAWVLAGDSARRSGRADAARERYRKALAVDAKDVASMTGLAEVELADGKTEVAADLIGKAVVLSPNDASAQLVLAEVSIKQAKLDDATARIEALASRQPPLPALDQARLKIVTGKLLEAEGKHEAAVDAYVEAAKLAGERDLTTTMTAVAKLSSMAKTAVEEGQPEQATALRARADQLLASLAEAAKKDAQVGFTLGMAYLQSGDAAKAEPLLRRVLETRATDVDVLYQLGKALAMLDRGSEGVEMLKKASAAAPNRIEIGLELARTYEKLGKDTEAGQLYTKLLSPADEAAAPTIELRAHAGRFFARTGHLDKAGEQGEKILAADPANAAGHYLKGEGFFAAKRFSEARTEFTEAVQSAREAQYLDALGRANEQVAIERNNDTGRQEEALRNYIAASELEPKMLNPYIGQGRLFVARNEMTKAVVALDKALKIDASAANNAEIAFLFGAAYQALGQNKVAVQWLERSSQKQPSAETSYRLGQLYADPSINQAGAAAGAYGTATRLAGEAAKKNGTAPPPWYADALFFYGRLSLDTGNEVAARSAWDQWLGTKPAPSARRTEVERILATTLRGVR